MSQRYGPRTRKFPARTSLRGRRSRRGVIKLDAGVTTGRPHHHNPISRIESGRSSRVEPHHRNRSRRPELGRIRRQRMARRRVVRALPRRQELGRQELVAGARELPPGHRPDAHHLDPDRHREAAAAEAARVAAPPQAEPVEAEPAAAGLDKLASEPRSPPPASTPVARTTSAPAKPQPIPAEAPQTSSIPVVDGQEPRPGRRRRHPAARHEQDTRGQHGRQPHRADGDQRAHRARPS